jgi:hypothetical protein
MTLMTVRGMNLDQLKEAHDFLKTEAGAKRREQQKADRAAKAAKADKGRRNPAMKPFEFWLALDDARQRLQLAEGETWYLKPHLFRWGTIPKKYAATKGASVKTHARPRDQKIPLAIYWLGGSIPDIGIEFARSN